VIVVGAGFFGLTIAERISNLLNLKVAVIERRNTIGGNAATYFDEETGIECHTYGSHLFHTSNEKVWKYISQFTAFNDYQHTVFSKTKNRYFQLPFNLQTLSAVVGRALTPDQAKEYLLNSTRGTTKLPENFEEKAISLVGPEIYELLIKGYTWKQWETEPKNLPSEIISRLPVRFNFNNNYFNDKYQGLPMGGYTRLFENMSKNVNIQIFLETDFFTVQNQVSKSQLVVFTGPVDRFYNYSEGKLSWRTLDFETSVVDTGDFQGSAVINYPDLDVPYTRIHEFRHLHPERDYIQSKTVIMKEFSRFAKERDEPYYPINTLADREILNKYRRKQQYEKNVLFGGRLGTYQYLDMHMAIASALQMFESEIVPRMAKK
jgi:UDP-galactopyranose mutase